MRSVWLRRGGVALLTAVGVGVVCRPGHFGLIRGGGIEPKRGRGPYLPVMVIRRSSASAGRDPDGHPAAGAADESTGTYPLLSGAAGYAYRPDPSDPSAASDPFAPSDPFAASEPFASSAPPADEEPPTEELDLTPPPQAAVVPDQVKAALRRRVATALAGAAVLLGVSALVIVGVTSGGDHQARLVAPPRAGGPAAAGEDPGRPAFEAGTFALAGDVNELTVTLGRTTRGPIQVGAPPGSGVTPATSVDGTDVRLTAESAGGSGPARLDVLLDERIAWTIRMEGGVRAASFVLTRGTVRAIDLSGGADTVSLALPDPGRVLPIRMSGGVREWTIVTETEVPVRVEVQSGAGEVSLYGKRERGIGRDTTLTAGDGSGLQVTAAAGFGTLAVSAP